MINKKTLKSKKGFTIIELVIVIAVIAILAAVLIPTFSNVTAKAKESAALSTAKNNMTNDLINAVGDYTIMDDYVDSEGVQYYVVKSYKGDNSNPVVTTDYTVTGTTVSLATGTNQDPDTTYYTLAAYSGVYSSSDNTWTDTVNGYDCTYNLTTGEWTVVESASST